MTKTIRQDIIKEHIIHRYENLLLDEVTINNEPEDDEITGSFKLSISNDDALGRQIFSKQKDKKILCPQLCMEALALASIVCSGKLQPGQMAIFAGISNFKKTKDLPFSETLIGHVEKQGRKKDFLKYKGTLKNEAGDLLANGDMMAFFVDQEISSEEQKKIPERSIPDSGTAINKANYTKPSQMVVLDEVLENSETSILGKYTYPKTHPFTKGHFPDNPIMMGIMQWMSVEDLAFAFIKTLNLTKSTTLTCNATIFKTDLTLVTEIKGFSCDCLINEANIADQCDVTETKKIMFRSMVKPGETILISLDNIQISQ